MNFEYERSFCVESINKYIKYCTENGFEKTKEVWQNRIVFENQNNNSLIARITKEKIGDNQTIVFDCKNVMKKEGNLNQSLESASLTISEQDIPAILSMLDVMGFYEAANNTRRRYVFSKEDVCFEIDEYTNPKKNVIAIEGKKEEVEKIYNSLIK